MYNAKDKEEEDAMSRPGPLPPFFIRARAKEPNR
jgi:hypothetical protein